MINPTIYARCFIAATRNPPRCKLCLSITHDTKDCCQQDVTEYGIERRLKSKEQTTQALIPTHPHPPVKLSGEVCRKWNRGECNYPFAGTHTCAACVMELTRKFDAPDAAAGAMVAIPLHGDLGRATQTIKSGSPTHQGD